MILTAVLAAAILSASPASPATTGASPGKLSAAVSAQMQDAIVAVNKALGLESWPMHDAKPCVDRGGQGITAKDVTPDETRKCAAGALDKGFPDLGKSYVLAIQMASIGPVTALAFGIGDAAGWGAYSCDPGRKCLPIKLASPAKWSKRTADRQAHVCADPATLWFPAGERACPPAATSP